MLRELLWGRMLEADLPGIDDPGALQAVRQACLRRSASIGKLLLWVCGLGIAAGALSECAGRFAGAPAWGSKLLFMCVVGAGLVPLSRWRQRRARRLLPDVLRSLGRCARCGYDLHGAEVCPECAQAASRA